MLKSGKKPLTYTLAAIFAFGVMTVSFAATGGQPKNAPAPTMAKTAPAISKAKKARHCEETDWTRSFETPPQRA